LLRSNSKNKIYRDYIEMNTLGKDAENRKLPNSYNTFEAKKDRKLGKLKEKRFERWIKDENFFPKNIFYKTKGWNEMDYISENDTIYLELKGRRVNKYDFDTTMIGHNKYIKARKLIMSGKKVYFFFSFRDRLCFFPVPTLLPSSIEIKEGGTFKRGFNEIKKHLYIPINLLCDVKDFPSIDYFNDYLKHIVYEETELLKELKKCQSLVKVSC